MMPDATREESVAVTVPNVVDGIVAGICDGKARI
jgi:hypothetical protein